MKWLKKPRRQVGTKRVVKKFAWFPYELNSTDVIWLESYWAEQEWIFGQFTLRYYWATRRTWQ